MLTEKQRELLDYIDSQILSTGVCPTFDEMCVAIGLKSKSGIHRLVVGLEERGYLRRLPNHKRALEVVRSSSSPASIVAAFDALWSRATQSERDEILTVIFGSLMRETGATNSDEVK